MRHPIKLVLNLPMHLSGSGVHIRFLAVSEVGFIGHRTGLKLMFFDISLFKLSPPPHTYGYFLLNESNHCCLQQSHIFATGVLAKAAFIVW